MMIEHMQACHPAEGCGFILKSGEWVPCENHAEEGRFHIHINDYLKHSGNIAKIVHSHVSDDPDSEGPSDSDIIHQKATGVAWLIVILDRDGNYVRQIQFGETII